PCMGISPCGVPGRPTHPDCTPTRPRLGREQVLKRESVTVQLWQRRADMAPQRFACRLLVDSIEQWHMALQSAPDQALPALLEQAWGTEWGISDCEGNRLLLVQSAPHAARRRASA
ncbi:hypothetical protein PMI15_03259, partial [Polaromonas sp. CF318]|uniref:hypothetical protein n=1 Tax=Polaromonas sp. CF318 TaxID=1144318 RepID=UPI0002711062